MDKEAIQALTKAYGKYVGSKPWIEAPVLGAVGATAGHLGAGFVVPKILKMLMLGKSEQEKADMLKEYEASDTLDLARKIMTGFGGIAGAGYGLQKHLDFNSGMDGLKDSFIQGRDYWDNPEAQEALQERKQKERDQTRYNPTRSYSSGRTFKTASDYSYGLPANFDQPRIPISESLNLIQEDPFLTLPQKEITDIVLGGAENSNSGLTSGKALMRSAMRLGVGASTGFIFGRAAGAMLALPSPITKRLSRVGALAGGIINTGIFSEIGK